MVVIFLAYYTKDQYELLLKTCADRKRLDDKWEDWLVQYIKAKSGLSNEFTTVEEVYINVQVMNEYFKANHLKNNSKNRAAYTSRIGSDEYNKKTRN